MKIGIITAVFPPYAGGQANVARDYASYAQANGHEVIVITPTKKRSIEITYINGYVVYGVPSFFSFGKASVVWNFDFLIDESFNLIHIHYPCVEMIHACGRIRKKYPLLPIITTYHMDLLASGISGFLFDFYSFFALKIIAKITTKFHVTSKDYFNFSALSKYVSSKSVVEIPLAVDTTFFSPLNCHNAKFSTVLFVGALDRAHTFKGIDILLKAWQIVLNKFPLARLIIVGKGELLKQYESIARNYKIEYAVNFVGFLTDEELVSYYRNATVTVLPSTTRSEAFGLVLAESQSCGTPVIASDLPGVRTAVDLKSGMLIAPSDARALSSAIIIFLGEDNSAVQSRKINSREFSLLHFNKSRISTNLLALYESLI